MKGFNGFVMVIDINEMTGIGAYQDTTKDSAS